MVDLGLGRVEVLGRRVVVARRRRAGQDAAGESEHLADRRQDREYEAVPEDVVDAAAPALAGGVSLSDEADGLEHVGVEASGRRRLREAVPPRRRVADAEREHGLLGERPLGEVVARTLPARPAELLDEVACREAERRVERALAVRRRAVLLGQQDAGAPGEQPHGVEEAYPFRFLDEREHISSLLAVVDGAELRRERVRTRHVDVDDVALAFECLDRADAAPVVLLAILAEEERVGSVFCPQRERPDRVASRRGVRLARHGNGPAGLHGHGVEPAHEVGRDARRQHARGPGLGPIPLGVRIQKRILDVVRPPERLGGGCSSLRLPSRTTSGRRLRGACSSTSPRTASCRDARARLRQARGGRAVQQRLRPRGAPRPDESSSGRRRGTRTLQRATGHTPEPSARRRGAPRSGPVAALSVYASRLRELSRVRP